MVHTGEPHTPFVISVLTARFREANNRVIAAQNSGRGVPKNTADLFFIHRAAVLGIPMTLQQALIRPDGRSTPLAILEGVAPPPRDVTIGFERKPPGTRPPSRPVVIDDPRQTSAPINPFTNNPIIKLKESLGIRVTRVDPLG